MKKSEKDPAAAASMQSQPSTEDIQIRQVANLSTETCDLQIKILKPGWVVRSVILFSDTIFTGGSFVVHPQQSGN